MFVLHTVFSPKVYRTVNETGPDWEDPMTTQTPQNPNTDRTLKLPDTPIKGKTKAQKNPTKTTTPAARPRRTSPLALSAAQADRLRTLAEFLPQREALLVHELLDRGRSIAHLARIFGESRTRMRTRMSRIITRTNDPSFAFVVSRRIGLSQRRGTHTLSLAAAASWPDDWSDSLRIAAQLCVLDGLSCREAAAKSGTSYHTLRRHLATLRELGRLWRSNTLLREAS
jgi:DNA-directed RNA polymerase specialized sigma24 family protein